MMHTTIPQNTDPTALIDISCEVLPQDEISDA